MEENKEEMNPDLAKIVNMFYIKSASTLKHEYDSNNKSKHRINFIDERFPQMQDKYNRRHLGSVLVEYDDNNAPRFTVQSRLIENQRYKNSGTAFHSKTSKSIDKTLKTMLDYVRPYSLEEVRRRTEHTFVSSVDKWVQEARRPYLNLRIDDRKQIIEELLHLNDLGVQFKTDVFRKLAGEIKSINDEHSRRIDAKFKAYHVVFTPKIIYVTAGKLSKNSYHDFRFEVDPAPAIPSTSYQTFESLPENILSGVGLLKIVPVGESVDEVGLRVNENEFYILEMLDNSNY